MHDLHALLTENAVEVEILDIESAAYLARTVVPDAGSAGAVSAVGYVYLMPVSPRAALRHLGTLEIHSAGAQVGLDEGRERAVLDEGGEDLDRQSEI